MDKNKILDKKETNELDRLTCFIYGAIYILHDDKIKIKDMKEIKKVISKIYKRYHPLDELLK